MRILYWLNSKFLLVLLSLSLFVFSGLVGCASFAPHTQMPASGKHIAIQVLELEPGMNDYPIGAYTIPNSQVVITKPRKISMLEGAFGLLGVIRWYWTISIAPSTLRDLRGSTNDSILRTKETVSNGVFLKRSLIRNIKCRAKNT